MCPCDQIFFVPAQGFDIVMRFNEDWTKETYGKPESVVRRATAFPFWPMYYDTKNNDIGADMEAGEGEGHGRAPGPVPLVAPSRNTDRSMSGRANGPRPGSEKPKCMGAYCSPGVCLSRARMLRSRA